MERVKTIMKRIGALFLAAALTISMLPEIEMKNVKGENLVEAYENDKTSTSELSEELCPVTEDVTMTVSDTPGNEPEELSQTYVDDSMVSVNLALQYIERDAFGYDEIQKRVVTKEVDKDTTLANIIEGLTFGEGKTEYEITGWKTDCDLNLTADNLPYYVYLDAEYEKVPVINKWEWKEEQGSKEKVELIWASPSWKVADLWKNASSPDGTNLWTTDTDINSSVEAYMTYAWEKTDGEEFPVILEYRYWDEKARDARKYVLVKANRGEKGSDILNRVDEFVPPCAENYGFLSWCIYGNDIEASQWECVSVNASYQKKRINVRCRVMGYYDYKLYDTIVVVSEEDHVRDVLRQLEPAPALEGTSFIKWYTDRYNEEDSVSKILWSQDKGPFMVYAEYDTPLAEINLYFLNDNGEWSEDTIITKVSPNMTYGEIKNLIPCPNSSNAEYKFKGWEFTDFYRNYENTTVLQYDTVSLKAVYNVDCLKIKQYYDIKDEKGIVRRKCLDSYVSIPVGMDYSEVPNYLCEVSDCCFNICEWKDLSGSYDKDWADRKIVKFEAVYKSFSININVTRYYMTKSYETKKINKTVSVTSNMTYNDVLRLIPLPKDALNSDNETVFLTCPEGKNEEIVDWEYDVVDGSEFIYGRNGLVCIEEYPEEEFRYIYIQYYDNAIHEYIWLIEPTYRGGKEYYYFDMLLKKYGCESWKEKPTKEFGSIGYTNFGNILIYYYDFYYSTAELIYHYLDGTTKTVIIDDDRLKYGDYSDYNYYLEEGHAWGIDKGAPMGVTSIDISYGGRYDVYEQATEKTRVYDLSNASDGHVWNEGKLVFYSYGAFLEYKCSHCGETFEIKNTSATTLAKADDGNWYDYVNGLVSTYTGLRYYNGSWWYVEKGKVNFGATTLCQYGGSWWYVQKGKVNFGATTLCNYGGTWWYVEKGKVNFGATTLCLYNGTWWYVEKGKVNFSATTLCQYGGSWWYVEKGKVNFSATTLCQYGGSWWYVQKGKVNFGATTLCNYGGTWWYVQKGKVNFGATTLCNYGGSWWYVEKGKVNFNATTLCNYGGKWWYVQKGKVNFGATTLCKYNGTWWYVEKGAVNFNYTGYFKYYGTNYRIVKGVVKF